MNYNETNKERTRLTPLGRKVLGGIAASAVVIGFGHDIAHEAKVGAEIVLDGGTSPTQHQLHADPQKEVVVKQGDTIWDLVHKVDPSVNAPTNGAIIGYVEGENHGSASIVPGQQLKVPIMDAKSPNSSNHG
jgi:outer membrane lipoprotein SlyB